MMRKTTGSGPILSALAILTAACGPNERIMQSANENTAAASSEQVPASANSAPTASSFERDLDSMRTADFKFIVVFRRKDGQVLTSEDKTLIGTNTGMQANRRRVSDEGRAVIIGGNFPFATKAMKELAEKFKMENYSKPDSGPLTSDAVSQGTPIGDKPRVDPVRIRP